MTLLVSAATNGKPPLLANPWARKSLIKLFQLNAISGGDDVAKQEEHRRLRNSCADTFASLLGLKEGNSQLQTEHFLVQHLTKGEYDSAPFSDEDQVPVESIVEREQQLIRQWDGVASKVSLTKQWMKEASSEARERGLLAKTEEWERRWGAVMHNGNSNANV